MEQPEQLWRIRKERGYTLSYHEIFARTEPDFLAAYAELYRHFTLKERHLSGRERELIWLGVLSAEKETVGTLHVERGYTAGLTTEEMAEAVAIACVVAGWRTLDFVSRTWQATLPFDLLGQYTGLLAAASPSLTPRETGLISLAVHAVHQHQEGFLHHLLQLYADGTEESHVAEAISYLLLPCGANAMLWATDVWLDAISEGTIQAGTTLAGVDTETRRS